MRRQVESHEFPKLSDRRLLGASQLQTGPICIGITRLPETIPAAFDAGVNFFFLSNDLHFSLYEATRQGLRMLLARGKSIRDEVVVGVVSYLDEPLFGALQVNETIEAVPGLDRVDVLIAGAVSMPHSFGPRVQSLQRAKAAIHGGATAMGASIHQRSYAVVADHYRLLDIAFCRYNAAHSNGRFDLFPYLRPDRTMALYTFKSIMAYVAPDRARGLGLSGDSWIPDIVDYYRFAFTPPQIDGLLCSPGSPAEFEALATALAKGPLRPEEEEHMIRLSRLAQAGTGAA